MCLCSSLHLYPFISFGNIPRIYLTINVSICQIVFLPLSLPHLSLSLCLSVSLSLYIYMKNMKCCILLDTLCIFSDTAIFKHNIYIYIYIYIIYIYIYIYTIYMYIKLNRSTKRSISFKTYLYCSYMNVCFQIVTFVREHLMFFSIFVSVYIEVTVLCQISFLFLLNSSLKQTKIWMGSCICFVF